MPRENDHSLSESIEPRKSATAVAGARNKELRNTRVGAPPTPD